MTYLDKFQNYIRKWKIGLISGATSGILLSFLLSKPELTLGLMIFGAILGIFFEYLSIKNSNVRKFTSNKVVFVIALILVIYLGVNIFSPTMLQSVSIPTMATWTGFVSPIKLAPLSLGVSGIWGFFKNFLSLGPILIAVGVALLPTPAFPLGIILTIIGAIIALAVGGVAVASIWTIFSNFKLIMILGFIIILFIIVAGAKKRR